MLAMACPPCVVADGEDTRGAAVAAKMAALNVHGFGGRLGDHGVDLGRCGCGVLRGCGGRLGVHGWIRKMRMRGFGWAWRSAGSGIMGWIWENADAGFWVGVAVGSGIMGWVRENADAGFCVGAAVGSGFMGWIWEMRMRGFGWAWQVGSGFMGWIWEIAGCGHFCVGAAVGPPCHGPPRAWPGIDPATHVFSCCPQQSHGWPGQARP